MAKLRGWWEARETRLDCALVLCCRWAHPSTDALRSQNAADDCEHAWDTSAARRCDRRADADATRVLSGRPERSTCR